MRCWPHTNRRSGAFLTSFRVLEQGGCPVLVLSRRPGERILIGDQICITILRTAGGSVRVGIEAPSDVTILRDELQALAELPLGEESVVSTPPTP